MGRTPHTEDQVRAQVLAYCERYAVSPGPEGLPPFPTGKRETRQHREWIVLYKAVQRLRRRQRQEDPAERAALLKAQKGRCPVCLDALAAEAATRIAREGAPGVVLHPACGDLVRLLQRLGPAALDRLRAAAFARD